MTPTAKTIQIYLPSGNPRGIRCAEMTTRTVKLIEIPRIHLKDFFTMPEAMQVGLYFLVGSDEEDSKPQLYVGQTGELKKRLDQHNKEKDFWERAFVALSTNNTMTQTHALYLEFQAIQTASDVDRYHLLNGNKGIQPHTPAPLQADCDELFYTLKVLISTLGQPIFEALNYAPNQPTSSTQPTEDEPMLFYCSGVDAEATGFYEEDGFVILQGSKFRKHAVNSLSAWGIKTRQTMINDGLLVDLDNNHFHLTQNYICKTPSGSAQLVLGRTSNGWVEWKNKHGQTLSDIYRTDNE